MPDDKITVEFTRTQVRAVQKLIDQTRRRERIRAACNDEDCSEKLKALDWMEAPLLRALPMPDEASGTERLR